MRLDAQRKGFSRWVGNAFGTNFQPLSGFVWEEDGHVVGNVSLVPFSYQGQRVDMIANVAVSPEFRRRGIARALTLTALEKSRKGLAKATWLQVRHDNEAAMNLYHDMGFISKACRTTWVGNPGTIAGEALSEYLVSNRLRSHWPQQQQWLETNYPSPLRWYFLLRMSAMGPGILAFLYRLIHELEIQHWSVEKDFKLIGVLSWQRSHRYSDYLWLAAAPDEEDAVLKNVLPLIRRTRWLDRPISLDFPEGRAVKVLTEASFSKKITLNWMEIKH
jgi:hypothetical protein